MHHIEMNTKREVRLLHIASGCDNIFFVEIKEACPSFSEDRNHEGGKKISTGIIYTPSYEIQQKEV
jgi:hypothetical protein